MKQNTMKRVSLAPPLFSTLPEEVEPHEKDEEEEENDKNDEKEEKEKEKEGDTMIIAFDMLHPPQCFLRHWTPAFGDTIAYHAF